MTASAPFRAHPVFERALVFPQGLEGEVAAQPRVEEEHQDDEQYQRYDEIRIG